MRVFKATIEITLITYFRRFLCLYFFYIGLGMIFTKSGYAQDPIYSQYYKNPESLNPAFSGISEDATIGAAFRSQWSGFQNAYRTYSLGYNQFFRSINSGFGLLAMVDNQGDGILINTRLSAFYSYRIKINKSSFLQSGIEISGIQSRLDWSKLIFGDQIDPILGPINPPAMPGSATTRQASENSRTYLDLGFGLLYSSPSFYAGLGLRHLNNPNVGFLDDSGPAGSRYPVLYTLIIGSEFTIGQQGYVMLKPNILLASQKDLFQLNLGFTLNFGQWATGFYYRHNSSFSDAVMSHLGFIYENFSFGYSYDLNVSRLANHSNGAHEFTFGVKIDNKSGTSSVNYSDCLNLFRY